MDFAAEVKVNSIVIVDILPIGKSALVFRYESRGANFAIYCLPGAANANAAIFSGPVISPT